MSHAQSLIELAQELPEAVLGEVVDFAEYLKQKQAVSTAAQAGSFAAYFGALKDAPLFGGRDPLEVQKELRDEWQR